MATGEQLKADISREPPEPPAEPAEPREDVQPLDGSPFDIRFEDLLKKFHRRMQREEVLQAKFRDLIDSIEQSLRPRQVVQNEL